MQPARCYFSKISDFLEIVSKSSEAHYKNRSSVNNVFDTEMFVSRNVRPVLEALIDEIEIAFDISEQMKVKQKLYGQATTIPGELVPQTVCADALRIQNGAYKLFVLKDRLNYEHKQQSELTSTVVCCKNLTTKSSLRRH